MRTNETRNDLIVRQRAVPQEVVDAAMKAWDDEEAEQGFRGYLSREARFRAAIIAAQDTVESKVSSGQSSSTSDLEQQLAEAREEIARLRKLVSSSEAERYRSCGELLICNTSLEASLASFERVMRSIEKEAVLANEVIRLNRDGQGQGRVKVATAMHRIAQTAAAALASIPASAPSLKATHRHKKEGSEYVLLGIGKLQAKTWEEVDQDGHFVRDVDKCEVAVLRSLEGGYLCVCPKEEFEDGHFYDGRFEEIAALITTGPEKQE